MLSSQGTEPKRSNFFGTLYLLSQHRPTTKKFGMVLVTHVGRDVFSRYHVPSHCILHKCVVRFIRDNTKLLVLARIEDLGTINLPKAAKLLLSTIFTIAA